MRTGAMVLGIIGGVLALLLGLVGFSLGQLGSSLGEDGAGIVMVLSLAIPVVALVGASTVKAKAGVGGALMLLSAVAIVLVLKVHFFSLLPGIPLAIAGFLGLAGRQEELA